MPESFQGEDGKIYSTQYDAEKWGSSSGGNGGDNIIIQILLAIPSIIARIVGTIFAFLSKLWIIGKFLQTFLFSLACSQIVISFFGTLLYFIPFDTVIMMAITIFVISGLWYWFFQYDVIKHLTGKELTHVLKKSFAIIFYGIIIGILFAGLISVLFSDTVGKIIAYVLLIAVFAASIVVYLAITRNLREEAAKLRKFKAFKKFITTTAALGLAVLTVASAVNITQGNDSFFENLFWGTNEDSIFRREIMEARAEPGNFDPSLNGLGHHKFASIKMRDNPHQDANEILQIPLGEFFAIKERSGRFYKIEYKGREGYVYRSSVKRPKRDRSAEANKHTRIFERSDYSANSNHLPRGTQFFLLGENVFGFVKIDYRGDTRWIPAADLRW